MMVNLFDERSAGSWAAGGIPRCIRAVAALRRHVEKRRVTQDGLMLRSTSTYCLNIRGFDLSLHFKHIIFCPIPPKKNAYFLPALIPQNPMV